MKAIRILLLAMMLWSADSYAQGPWKMLLYDSTEKITLKLDLYEESIAVPGMEDFGPMNGYMNGNIYGVWTITSFKIKDDKSATLRLSNDLGSETQEAELQFINDSTLTLNLKGTTVVRRVVGKKLEKITPTLHFKPRK